MLWPARPTCHDPSWQAQRFGETTWQVRGATRHCSYCGSIHPEDLVDYLTEPGHTLGGADHKYGWPHKFYLQGGPYGKWYNEHLLDAGYDPDALLALCDLIRRHSHIEFFFVEENGIRRLKWRAPYAGYQK